MSDASDDVDDDDESYEPIHILAGGQEITPEQAATLAPIIEAEGRAAFAAGMTPYDCRHVAGEPLYAWERGWYGARDEAACP